MRILIVEDEPPAAEHLARLLGRTDETFDVVGILTSVAEGVDWLDHNIAPDLIFMDIQLSDGLSFSVFDQVEVSSPVIFTTAYDQYALKAFKVNSIDYLLKPIAQDDLARALQKWRNLQTQHKQSMNISREDIRAIMQNMKPEYKQRFLVKAGRHLKSITVEDIAAFQSRDKITYLVNVNGRRYAVDYTLSDLESLIDPRQFFRINRQDIVSHHSIADVVSYSNSRLKIVSKHAPESGIIVSRDRVPDFRKWLDQ